MNALWELQRMHEKYLSDSDDEESEFEQNNEGRESFRQLLRKTKQEGGTKKDKRGKCVFMGKGREVLNIINFSSSKTNKQWKCSECIERCKKVNT